MEMIAKYLRQFLAHNDLAYVPGLGIFEAEDKKAELNPSTKEMAPPMRSVVFQQKSSKDESFIDFLSRIEGKSNIESKKDLKIWVDGLKKEIVAKKKVELPGLGSLGINAAKKVDFKPMSDLNISPDALGLQAVKAEISARKEASKTAAEKEKSEKTVKPEVLKTSEAIVVKPSAEKKTEDSVKKIEEVKKPVVQKKEEKKQNPMVLVIIIIAILVLASALGYYFLKMNKHEEPPVVQKVEKPAPVVEEVAPEPEPEPVPEPIVTISERSGRFYLIGNSFEIKENAYKYRDYIISKGHPESKIILPDNKIRLYRVSITESDDLKTAIAKMEELYSEFGESIWVLTY